MIITYRFCLLAFAVMILLVSGYKASNGTGPDLASHDAKPWPLSNQENLLGVQSGSGGGSYPPGATVHVWADPAPPDHVFERWVGEATVLETPTAYHTTLLMPEASITITATYKYAPTWQFTLEEIADWPVYYYFPPMPRGVVTLYHGTNGNANTWAKPVNVEKTLLTQELAAAGYAIVATESTERGEGAQWSLAHPLETNPDAQRMQTILDEFKRRGLFEADTPIYSLGMSQGGGFAFFIAAVLQFRAAAVFCTGGVTAVAQETTAPTQWNLCQNDGIANNARAQANYQTLIERGIPAELNVLGPSPVYPLRFWRIPGMTAADSEALFEAFEAGGLFDEQGFLRENPDSRAYPAPDEPAWKSLTPQQYQVFGRSIQEQLNVSYSAHEFYSDHNSKVIAFFEAHRTKMIYLPLVINSPGT